MPAPTRRLLHFRCTLPWLCAALLPSCIVVPRTVEVYDPECQVVARHMDLQAVQIGYISRCSNQGCAALIVAAAATVTATAIISGSIVVIGNTVYWFEKQGRCNPLPE
ncbi:MAG: hypothetical protein HZC22_14975 [Rhodocyclales bacterium]|nr:hypothetical protein [Rhodocyclales bacterium]